MSTVSTLSAGEGIDGTVITDNGSLYFPKECKQLRAMQALLDNVTAVIGFDEISTFKEETTASAGTSSGASNALSENAKQWAGEIRRYFLYWCDQGFILPKNRASEYVEGWHAGFVLRLWREIIRESNGDSDIADDRYLPVVKGNVVTFQVMFRRVQSAVRDQENDEEVWRRACEDGYVDGVLQNRAKAQQREP